MTAKEFQEIAHTIPHHPGIYKYFDAQHELLYVGKAKDLRKRTSSYFTKTFTNYKTHELVQRIRSVEFTITNSEADAFLLENSLIKQFKPKFNIDLKDDKSFPFIVIKKEPFPRVFLTRTKVNDGSEYLGPFTSVAKVRELLIFIKQNVALRTCKLNLTRPNIQKGKFKVCLEYHLGNCKGPCEAKQSEQDYAEALHQIRNLLKGNLQPVIQHFKAEMIGHATNLSFEKAEMVRKKIEHLENYQERSVIVGKHLSNLDVFSILKDGDTAYVNYLMVYNGAIVQTHTVRIETKLEENEAEVLPLAIMRSRETFNSQANEIIVPFEIDFALHEITVTVPRAGDKKKLLDLSVKNVNYFTEELRKKKLLLLEGKSDTQKKEVLYQLQHDLQLGQVPVYIECFDNSNFQGSYPVSAMVCFKEGIPSKNDYRHYNVKTVEGINDFATMKEVVYRRYSRLIKEEHPLPQLIIIDGGKGQLSSAMESIIGLNLAGAVTVIGLAKNEEEIFFTGDKESIKLAWDSESLKLIRRIRDEVHRFGINFHRNKRSKGTFKNELENIKGIGKSTAETMLKEFKSVRNIQTKSREEIARIVGLSKAVIITEYFNPRKENKE
jgi:excinuclease ABC subunit C